MTYSSFVSSSKFKKRDVEIFLFQEYYALEDQIATEAGTPALYARFVKEAALLREDLEKVERGEVGDCG